ncbi:hypothetical protein TNCV_2508591 [Trichonephila clavipes]|nr:hypothetical protein TNCV_2508591 [Trichonephila clavipes]
MAAEWADLVSSQAKSMMVYSQEVLFGGKANPVNGLGSLQVPWDRTHRGQDPPKLSKTLDFMCCGSKFVNVCGYHAFCSSEGQGDLRLRRFSFLLGFLVGCLINLDPKSCYLGHTAGLSWRHGSILCDRVLKAMTPHTITSAVGMVCPCKAKAGLRRSPLGFHTRTRLSSLLRLNLDSRVAKDNLAPFHSSPVSSCAAPLQTEALMGGLQVQHT